MQYENIACNVIYCHSRAQITVILIGIGSSIDRPTNEIALTNKWFVIKYQSTVNVSLVLTLLLIGDINLVLIGVSVTTLKWPYPYVAALCWQVSFLRSQN